MSDMFRLAERAQRMRKVIVFVSGPFGRDPLTLDLRQNRADSHMNLILAIISFAAEVESQAIKERAHSTRAFLLPTDRWMGGIPGYGYRLVDHPVKGKTIKRDEYMAAVIWEIAGWLCDEDEPVALTAIVHKLNESGELTYRDYLRTEQGKPTRSRGRGAHSKIDRELWSVQAIKTIMTSPRLLGYKVHKGKPAIGLDRAPVRIAEPILSLEEFQRVQNALNARSRDPGRTRSTTPLLSVIKCGVCGCNASRRIQTNRHGKRYAYYCCCNQRGQFTSNGCTSCSVRPSRC
jgi:site-specific DNA recombinase